MMKKYNGIFCTMVFVGLLMVSCSKDDDPTLENEQNAIEERIIPASELGAGIEIVGGTKKNGALPTPNGNLDFDINPDQQEAFQSFGFDVRFSSTASITGAYIQFQDMSGNKADGYFDVSLSDAENGRFHHGHLKKTNTLLSGARTNEDDELEINVDFDKTILPGQFCYEICVYDAEGNISQPQKVCVKVEAWGGNAAIAGEWVFDRNEPVDEGDNQRTVYCKDDQTITVDYRLTEKEEWTFVLNEDGSYYEILEQIYIGLDFPASAASCSVVYFEETEEEKDKYSGHWAYNEEEQTLTVVDFKYEDLLDASNNEVDEEGELYFEGAKAEVIDGELVLTATYTEEDGVTETEKYIFKRK